jgi:hypothetical protein
MDATITKFGGQFVFRNIQVNAANHLRQCILVRNRGFTGDPFDVLCDNITYIAPNATSASFAVVSINTVSGDGCSRVQATNIVSLRSTITPALALASIDLASCLIRQDSISGLASVTTSTSTYFADDAITYDKRFARTPHVTLVATDDTTGTDCCAGYALLQDNLGFIARYIRVDTALANFTNAVTRTMSWTATLREW